MFTNTFFTAAEEVGKTISWEEHLRANAKFLQENKSYCKKIYNKKESGQVFYEIHVQQFRFIVSKYTVLDETMEFQIRFFANAWFLLLSQWLEEDCQSDMNLAIDRIGEFVSDQFRCYLQFKQGN